MQTGIPEHWFDDPERCREAGIPESLAFRTKGQIALDLLLRLRREGLPSMLSCHDLIDILRHKLPSKVRTDDDMTAMITERHRRRLDAMQSAYKKQAETLGGAKNRPERRF